MHVARVNNVAMNITDSLTNDVFFSFTRLGIRMRFASRQINGNILATVFCWFVTCNLREPDSSEPVLPANRIGPYLPKSRLVQLDRNPVTNLFNERHVMKIQRMEVGPRMSQAVIHGNTVYTAGQVALDQPGASVTDQTRNILARIDRLLADAGSNKTNLLSATIWLADIADFGEMNAVWDAWVAAGDTPCRACVESKLASPDFKVEIQVVAAR